MTAEIILAAGCFWCYQPLFAQIKGVKACEVGYCDGAPGTKASYESLKSTGHVECFRVVYEPDQIQLSTLLDVFFSVHDPTQKDRQGHDVGRQYRSGVYYTDAAELPIINAALERARALWPSPIVTEVKKLDSFTIGEDYHQNYAALNPQNQFCQVVVNPKLAKARQKWQHLLAN